MEYREAAYNFFKGSEDLRFFFAPGRVNLIGEHIDYNGGPVLPCALSIGIYAAVRDRGDNIVSLNSDSQKLSIEFNLDDSIEYREEDGWTNYPKGVISALIDAGYRLKGGDLYFYSTLPSSSGLSSSAALELLTAYAILMASGYRDEEIDRVKLAILCMTVENKFVGVDCGIMDQFAVAMGKKDHAVLLNCDSLNYRMIPVNLGEYSVVIMNTGKKRSLANSQFNQRVEECRRALAILRDRLDIKNLSEIDSLDSLEILRDDILIRRVRHIVTETKRVLRSCELLENNKLIEFGQILTQSHISLKYDFEASCYELDVITDEAMKIDGTLGARMTGAGWGGCALAITKTSQVASLVKKVSKVYKGLTDIKPSFYTGAIESGVREIKDA